MLFTVFATVLALSGTVMGQAVDPRTVPDCIRQCTIKATLAAGCRSPLDVACVCGPKANTFQSAALNCLLADPNCSSRISEAYALSSRLCKDGVACPTDDPARWAMCSDLCIDKTIQSCVSGVPVNPTSIPGRRSVTVTFCEPHERMCQVGQLFGVGNEAGFGYECLDVYSNLEACGGCPGEGGVDCTGLYGVVDVACLKGKCIISECEEGLSLIHGRCK